MTAQIQELTNHYRLWNDFDEWFVEKATGLQIANNLGDEWAHIWAGFRGQENPGDPYDEFLVDAGSWTWSTDSDTGWVKLIGDASFAPGNKIDVRIEWTLEDNDRLIEFKWKTTNDWKDFNDVKQIIRNGQIDVNGGGSDCWFRVYDSSGGIHADGQLPADASYNNITDSLENRYKLIGNSKNIDWRWNETFDKNGTPTTSDVTVNVVNTNGTYGSNGYVEHVFNVGPVNKNEYIETVQHWHDAEEDYLASVRNFEMDGLGTDRNYVGDGGNTLDSDKWFGMCWPPNAADQSVLSLVNADRKYASKITGVRRLEKVLFLVSASTGTYTARVSIQNDSGGFPDGSPITNLSATIGSGSVSVGWNELSFTGADLTDTTEYWLVFEFTSWTSGTLTLDSAQATGLDLTNSYMLQTAWYVSSWSDLGDERAITCLLYGKSDAGYYNIMHYGTESNIIVGGSDPGAAYYPTIINDEDTLYRTVFQIKPLDDNWKRSMDADDETTLRESSGSQVDWNGFNNAPSGSDKWLIDEGLGPSTLGLNVFVESHVTSPQTSEWNGTDTNIPGTGVAPVQKGHFDSSRDYIDAWYSGSNWQEAQSATTDTDQYCSHEYWFTVTTEFDVDDEPEVKGFWTAGGGGVQLTGLNYTYLVITAAEDITIIMDPGALIATAQSLTLVPGAVHTHMDPGAIIATAENLTVVPGETTLPMDPGALTATAENLTVVPGPGSVSMNNAALTATAENLTLVPGAVTFPMDPAALIATAEILTVVPGVVSLPMDPAALTATAEILTVVPGAITLPMDPAALIATAQILTLFSEVTLPMSPAALIATAQILTVVPGAITLPMDPAALIATAQILTMVPGAVTLPMNPAALTATAEILTLLLQVVISMNPGALTATAQSLTMVPGAVTFPMNPAALIATAEILTMVPGAVTLPMNAGAINVTAQSLSVITAILVALAAAGVTVTAQSLTVVPGAVSLPMDPAALIATAQILTLFSEVTVNMNTGALIATPESLTLVPGAVTLPMDPGAITATPENLTVVPGPGSVSMNKATLIITPESLTLVPGAVTSLMDPGALIATPETLTVVPGPGSVPMNNAALTATAETLTLVPGTITITMNTAALSGTAQILTLSLEISIPMDPAALTATPESLTLVPGTATIPMNTALLTGVAQNLTLFSEVSVSMNAGAINVTAQSLSVITAILVALAAAGVTVTAQPLNLAPGEATISMQVANINLTGETIQVSPGAVTVSANPATINAIAQQLQVVPGEITIAMQDAQITGIAETIQVFSGATVITMQTAQIVSAGEQLQVIPGPVTITLQDAQMSITAQNLTIASFTKILIKGINKVTGEPIVIEGEIKDR